tara:strand:- start:1316 stop:1900 length:585 start_codon:yes stop_codon:yes gene_type:complete
MGLKQDLLDAVTSAYVDTNPDGDSSNLPDTSDGSYAERLAHYQTEAIANFITQCEFTITQLKAPVVVEDLKTPEQPVNIKIETLLGDKAPILKTLKKIGEVIPGAGQVIDSLVDELEAAIRQAVRPLTKGGAVFKGFNISKDGQQGDGGGLISQGYVYIGEDPEALKSFDVTDTDGQRDFTTVKVFREDIEELL